MDCSADTVVRECINCGAAREGPYCTHCGQLELQGPHSLRTMIGGVVGRVFNLERGLVHTALRLTASPGEVVRDYLAGRTVPYTHPFGYLLISFAAFVLLAKVLGGAAGGTGSENRFFTLLLVPFVAGVSRLLFWRSGLTIAEHLILCMYLLGHAVLLLAILQLTVPFAAGAMLYVLGFGGLGAVLGYVVWGYSRIFKTRPALAAIGGLVSLGGGILLWGAAVFGLVSVLRH